MKYNCLQELYLKCALIDIVECFRDELTKEELMSMLITLLVQIDFEDSGRGIMITNE